MDLEALGALIENLKRLVEKQRYPGEFWNAHVVTADDGRHSNPQGVLNLNSSSSWIVGPRRKTQRDAQVDAALASLLVTHAPAIIAVMERVEKLQKVTLRLRNAVGPHVEGQLTTAELHAIWREFKAVVDGPA